MADKGVQKCSLVEVNRVVEISLENYLSQEGLCQQRMHCYKFHKNLRRTLIFFLLEIKTDRFDNFYIDVSNNTIERLRCYTDNIPGVPAEIDTITCPHIAQYVIVETTHSSHGGVYLEIAEIQVFGCTIQTNNYPCPTECIGDLSCGQTCSQNCEGDCNRMTGECINGCKEGWRGIQCDSKHCLN
ncbi:uncharacterized protein LOC134243770 [Saccostrea cucullata]|uniref:uncharacterized protein LOC134243770 n=1 Tax=Saccostrea cuccullata TaxID=36930 RepID=UPI002ED082D0